MLHRLALAFTAWLVIFSLRAFPFVILSRAERISPRFLKAAEKWLSPIVIAFLVVYSIGELEWKEPHPYIASALVVALELLFKNGLLAIFAGTALYMYLVA